MSQEDINDIMGGGDSFILSEADEEALDRVWRSPEVVGAILAQRDREEGTAGKTLDWRTGRPLTAEEIEFNDHGPYSKGEKKRTAAEWQAIYDYEQSAGIENTIPDEYRHFVPALSGGKVTSIAEKKTAKKTKTS